MAEVKATRSELLAIKKRVKLAQSGHKLLKKKRDGLILEFFSVLKKARNMRRELNEKYMASHQKMLGSIATKGIVDVKSLSLALKERPGIELEVKNIMGVTVPSIKHGSIKKGVLGRGYGLLAASPMLDDMARSYEDLLESVITAAEVETTLRKLLSEIEKTKRRVNALEFVLIPRLKKQQDFINLRLEEMERENIFRMKRIKAAG